MIYERFVVFCNMAALLRSRPPRLGYLVACGILVLFARHPPVKLGQKNDTGRVSIGLRRGQLRVLSYRSHVHPQMLGYRMRMFNWLYRTS